MIGWFEAVVLLVAAANPAVLAGSGPERRGTAAGLLLAAALAMAGDGIIDMLSVSVPTFLSAAGVVVAVGGGADVFRRRATDPSDDGPLPGLLRAMSPPLVFAAVATSTAGSRVMVAVSLAVVAGFTVLVSRATPEVRRTLSVSTGALAVGLGVLLTITGLRSV